MEQDPWDRTVEVCKVVEEDSAAAEVGAVDFGGPEGNCKCPNCNYEQIHQLGTPCAQTKCPECGTMMVRM